MEFNAFFTRSMVKNFPANHQFGSTYVNLISISNMSLQEVKHYITHLPEFKVVICQPCEIGIPPKDPLRHYKQNHTAKKNHPVSMEVRRKVEEYMATLDLVEPDKVICPREPVPHLKMIEDGFVCNFPGCGQCSISESSMRTHYYTHQKHIPKGFKDWESTSIQTFFEGHHKRYDK
jgi:Orsellinic acid/F9775 biosynthesis cluster protein D